MQQKIDQYKFSAMGLCIAIFITGCSSTPVQTPQTHTPIHEQNVVMHAVTKKGIGQKIGTIHLKDGPSGLIITTQLSQLPSGPHGFHIHEKGSCNPAEKDGKMAAALAAGGHFNPKNSPHHGSPISGHLGDLPFILVNIDGTANVTLVAPRVKLADVQGRAMMIHAGGDNYEDQPKPLGGGGDRIACGVIS